jgi:hypothetical protein
LRRSLQLTFSQRGASLIDGAFQSMRSPSPSTNTAYPPNHSAPYALHPQLGLATICASQSVSLELHRSPTNYQHTPELPAISRLIGASSLSYTPNIKQKCTFVAMTSLTDAVTSCRFFASAGAARFQVHCNKQTNI